MRIVESLSDVYTAKPLAQEILENVEVIHSYHEIYGARHPLAAYNTSLASVAHRIIKVIEVLNDIQKQNEFDPSRRKGQDSEREVALVEATDHMLDTLMEHMEDCAGIIRSFFPNSKDKDFKSALKKYKASVAPYRNYIANIVNYLKHNQGRLCLISFSWQGGSSLGYFVEGPVSNDGLGPVSVVHPDEASAFSYYRDIPFHLCNIYAVSRRLALTLHDIDKNLKPKKTTHKKHQKSSIANALEMASKLPYIYFDDEVKKGVPYIKIGSNSIKIEYPSSKVKSIKMPRDHSVGITYRGDGYTRTYKIPYSNLQY